MSLIGPLICLWYYLSSGHTLEFSWYTSQYYFDSNSLFTFLVAILGACLSEKPIHSLINLRKDIKRADLDERNSIAAFESTIASQYHRESQLSKSLAGKQQTYQEVDKLLTGGGTD